MTVTLLEFATRTYPAGRLDLDPKTEYFYAMVARLLTEFAKTQAAFPQYKNGIKLKQLKPEIVLAWLKHLTTLGRAAKTVNSYRASIITLWKAAAKRHGAPPAPDLEDLPRRKTPVDCPTSWLPEELEHLLQQCELLKGTLQRWPTIKRRDFWVSLLLFLYETGARIGAALDMQPGDVDLKNRLIRLRSGSAKTLLEQPIRISQQCANAIELIFDDQREKVWPCGKHRHELYNRLKSLLKAAGLPSDRLSKFHRIRRTTATQTALHGSLEMAQRQLGHTSIKMTLRYIDTRILRPVQAVDVIPPLHLGN